MTIEQQFKMKQIENALRNEETQKEDIITVFLALQHQNFVLSNTVANLVKKWPTQIPQDRRTTNGEAFKSGTSSETKD